MQQQQYQQKSWNNTQQQQQQDEIIYSTENVKKPRETKKVGDYVDYEEID